MSKKFSVIIPTYNSREFVSSAIESVRAQKSQDFEIILIDDCSTDSTFELCKKFVDDRTFLFRTEKNSGPGIARNIGIDRASGDYILFLDSDDRFAEDFFEKLLPLTESNPDIISFEKSAPPPPRIDLLKIVLRLNMDCCVIFTAFRREFLKKHDFRFRAGLHEDVDFIFRAYFFAESMVNAKLNGYLKHNRDGSIVNSISPAHLEGYFGAFREMWRLIEGDSELERAWFDGIDNLCAIKIRDLVRLNASDDLYEELYRLWFSMRIPKFRTKFQKIVDEFLRDRKNVAKFFRSIEKKSWSCYDLRHSIFLAPDEVRTCCKRFFRDGKIRGDVAIKKFSHAENSTDLSRDLSELSIEEIIAAKRKLEFDINRGVETECSGCPYLSFEDWKSYSIEKISMEYHTLCNLRCQYCSEIFYGGKRPRYDVQKFIESLVKKDLLRDCRNIIWGGGEPAIEQNFDSLIKLLADSQKNLRQLVITNATIFSQSIFELLSQDRIVTVTSIDAGSESCFQKIRGQNLLTRVLENLKKYSRANSKNMIIKYILLDENSDVSELKKFVELVREFELLDCGFQISTNFKTPRADKKILESAVALYGLLLDAGAGVIYFDELLRDRIGKISQDRIAAIQKFLATQKIPDPIEKPTSDRFVIYGSLNQIQSLLENTNFFRESKPYKIFASHSEDVGKIVDGIQIELPEFDSASKIIIAAVQGTYKLIKELPNPSQRIRKLIL